MGNKKKYPRFFIKFHNSYIASYLNQNNKLESISVEYKSLANSENIARTGPKTETPHHLLYYWVVCFVMMAIGIYVNL